MNSGQMMLLQSILCELWGNVMEPDEAYQAIDDMIDNIVDNAKRSVE